MIWHCLTSLILIKNRPYYGIFINFWTVASRPSVMQYCSIAMQYCNTFFKYCKSIAILFKNWSIELLQDFFFEKTIAILFAEKKMNWQWILSPFWKNIQKFLKIIISISIMAVSISFKMILTIITIFKLLFFIQNNCLKSIEVLQYFNTFLNSKSIAKCNIAILFQPSIAKTIAILFKSIDWRSDPLYIFIKLFVTF